MQVPLAFGIVGLIVGSFLNVVIFRWGRRSLSGRSQCESCHRTIASYDLIPVFSWLALQGRCRFCKARIATQYPLVEAGIAFLFVLIGLSPLPLYLRLSALPIAAILVAIAVYDFRHAVIPDTWVWTFNAIAFFSIFAFPWHLLPGTSYLAILAGPITALPLLALWIVSRGAWMGFGDVKLALGMGFLLGIGGGLEALLLAFLLGAIISLPLLFFSSQLWRRILVKISPAIVSRKFLLGFTMKSEVPFGPFLIVSTGIIWILNMYGIALPPSFMLEALRW